MEKNLAVHSTLQYATHMCMASLGSFVFLPFFSFFCPFSSPFLQKEIAVHVSGNVLHYLKLPQKCMQNKEMQKGQNFILVFLLDISQGEQAGWLRSGN